jgi:hypothetical protein
VRLLEKRNCSGSVPVIATLTSSQYSFDSSNDGVVASISGVEWSLIVESDSSDRAYKLMVQMHTMLDARRFHHTTGTP